MDNSFEIDMNRQVDSLANYGIPSDPTERKRYEAQMRAKANQQAPQQAQAQPVAAPQETTGKRRFLVNNMARPIHIPASEGVPEVIIDGQLAVSARGPFIQIGDEQLENNYLLQDYLERPITNNPRHPLYGKSRVEEVSQQEFRRLHSDYLKQKVVRDSEYAKVGNTSTGTHADGTADEFEKAQDYINVNPTIMRANG